MIRVRNLRVDYDDFCAVRDLNLEVGPGQVCGLIGPNGAGKTTTLRAIVGLIEPTSGQVEIDGIDMVAHPHDACRLVAFMPDFPPIYEDLKAWEFLDLFAAAYGIPQVRRSAVVEQYLELVGLTEKTHAMVTELSRGMRQRLMLAKSLIPEPKVLLLDEPASGMDPHGRIDLKNILKDLGSQGKTVIVSSHVLSEMTEFCTSVVVMERGQIVVSGDIATVRDRVMGGSSIILHVLDGADRVVEAAAANPHAGQAAEEPDGSILVPFRGDDEAAADFLAELIRREIRVASFARRKEGLEELFLKVGARELS